jgi:hypothetical protein
MSDFSSRTTPPKQGERKPQDEKHPGLVQPTDITDVDSKPADAFTKTLKTNAGR